MEHVYDRVFGAPWWVQAIAGGVVAAFLLYALARRDRMLVRVSLLCVAAALLWAALAAVIRTPVEQARDHAVATVEAYRDQDWEKLSTLLNDDTRLSTLLMGQDIVRAAQMTHQQMDHRDIEVTRIESARDDLGIRIDLRVRSEQRSGFMRPFVTAWRFDYFKRGDEWRLERIEPRPTNYIDPKDVLSRVPIPEGARR